MSTPLPIKRSRDFNSTIEEVKQLNESITQNNLNNQPGIRYVDLSREQRVTLGMGELFNGNLDGVQILERVLEPTVISNIGR